MADIIQLDDRRKKPSRLQIAEAIAEKDHVVDAIQQICLKAIQKVKEDNDA